ncbi:MAG: iron-sulfur cluster assembly scaffold protein [Patescibacteria group bacterium]
MEFIYQQQILDHFKNPRHKGELAGAKITHCEDNVTCGDTICMYEKNGHYSFTGTGCAISQASASMLLEKIAHDKMTTAQIAMLTTHDILDLVKIPLSPNRLKCALLALETLQKTI